MPEDSKKNSDKKKNDLKEQRKPRHQRNQAAKLDRKAEKTEDTKTAPKVSAPEKPVYEDPGPEFYKNLKRETEEIVKITESENAKYKKKEIQSNWAKYEMPIASYDDVDEQDVGADYEKLIQAPLSAGGHFQFKHEKSWDMNTAPSLYDKYFKINMDNLSTAISTVPFLERNNINQSLFSETDLLSMSSRASKYKLKYFNDKKYSTPETEAQDTILKKIASKEKTNDTTEYEKVLQEKVSELDARSDEYNINLDFNVSKTDSVKTLNDDEQDDKPETYESIDDEYIFKDVPHSEFKNFKSESKATIEEVIDENNKAPLKQPQVTINIAAAPSKLAETKPNNKALAEKEHPVSPKVNPVIESPEDLEKWLDDFLDNEQ